MKLEDYVKEIKDDVKDIQKTVNELVIFMEVEKDKAKRTAIFAGGTMSLIVSLLVIAAEKVLS